MLDWPLIAKIAIIALLPASQGPMAVMLFTFLIADDIHADDRLRFAPGRRWQVYEFRHSRHRAVLTEANEDVLREGYELSGPRLGTECGGGTGYGSEIVARGFRGPHTRRDGDRGAEVACHPRGHRLASRRASRTY